MKKILSSILVLFVFSLVLFLTSCGKDDSVSNTNPEINDQSFSVDENSSNGTVVGTVVATDADTGQSLSFSIISGNTDDAFLISNVGQLTVATSNALDFETTSTFQLGLQVEDDAGGTSLATVTVTLIDVNEIHIVEDQSFSIEENSDRGVAVGAVTVLDPEEGSFTFSIKSGNDNNSLSINEEGTIMVENACDLDYEEATTIDLVVSVEDAEFSVDGNITVELINNTLFDGLVTYLPFIGDANDESCDAFDGNVQGAALAEDRNGSPNSAYSFDGIDDVIETSNEIDEHLGNGVTFSVWMKPSRLDESQIFISNYSGLGDPGNCNGRIGFYLRIESDNAVAIRYATDGNDFIGSKSSPNSIAVDVWQHVTLSWDGSISSPMFKIYLDGNALPLVSASEGIVGCASGLIESTDPFRFGYHQCAAGPCQAYQGMLDDLRIYSRVLTDSEVSILAGL